MPSVNRKSIWIMIYNNNIVTITPFYFKSFVGMVNQPSISHTMLLIILLLAERE